MAITSVFHMPFEGKQHARTLTAWPDQISQKDNVDLKGAETDVAAIANAIVKFEPVTLLCNPKNISKAKALVSPLVDIKEIEVDELWIRDTGPVYVTDANGQLVGLDLNFNYWGNKYPGTVDSKVASLALAKDGTKRIQAPFVAEGGAIEVDGEGTLLATESSLINDNRNPGMTKADLERHFKSYLGVTKVIWVKGAKDQDITDWHIDALARFACPGTVLLSQPGTESSQVVTDTFKNAKSVLEAETDAKGRKLQVYEVEEANPSLFDGEPYQVVLSYLNYLLVNGGVLIPAFGDEAADGKALRLFKKVFPDREVAQVHLSTLRRLGGGIHCATQQVPEV
ncbi:peptidyl-arginine deiminase family protein [Pochonia chlamydosporia 170]|uniref:Peptidyl-arginine deiminase family protein n=1 Tax=Pochonia chlamydosporia 170 TaxID=1380566 RepID=A0A179EYS0_METCM|nr:peptidyl-arginine deiminase family protein [Pochonia chlamydosporia 170]OAQ58318.1 peptidyl-arginine deiminase family protein [Pochonia chlamydosporia 170]